MKEDLRKKAEFNEMMLQRASQLVDGLSGERERWLITVKASTLLHFVLSVFWKECLLLKKNN